MQLHIFVAVAVLCCAFHAAKENSFQGGDAKPDRGLGSNDVPLARDNASSSSSSSFPFPTGSLLTLQLRQSPGVAQDARRARQRRLSAGNNYTEQTPLFQGMGVHYSYLWVGTPPQRVSVIIDTGSHHTAFPCVGCKCGKHMDPHFDPAKSSSAVVRDCSGKKCFYRQSYSEGSSWNAFKVSDRLWVGGPAKDKSPFEAARWTVAFEFGCQDHETGLFRTQNIDGIMGMSAAPNTLPFQLQDQRLTQSKVFALCFKVGGGVLTLGGADPALHRPGGGAIRQQDGLASDLGIVKLLRSRGWFTVRLLDVRMRAQPLPQKPEAGQGQVNADSFSRSIGAPSDQLSSGKGTIVDSGTTDTYLPKAVEGKFKALFRELSGMQFHNNEVTLSAAQFARLPVVVFRLEAPGPGPGPQAFIDVECPPSSYVEVVSGGHGHGPKRYAIRIYLTEMSGAVLGANFMNDFNVIFDVDKLQLAMARADCSYDDKHNRAPDPETDSAAATGDNFLPAAADRNATATHSPAAAAARQKKGHSSKKPTFLFRASQG